MTPITDDGTYDVAAVDDPELIGEGVDPWLARLIVGCLDCPAVVTVHGALQNVKDVPG